MIAVREIADAGLFIIEPGPRLTLENAQELLRIVRGTATAIAPSVIINMAKTSTLDSSGVGMLVNSFKHVQRLKGNFALVELQPEVLRMLQLMNLHQLFDIYETEGLARKQFTASRR